MNISERRCSISKSDPGNQHPHWYQATSTEPDIVTLNVVVVYEDATAGHRAVRTLRNLLRAIDPPVGLRPMLWRFDMVQQSQFRAVADADADQAELFLVSTSSPGELPAAIDHWVSACLARRQGAAIAIVALLGSSDAWTITTRGEHGITTASRMTDGRTHFHERY